MGKPTHHLSQARQLAEGTETWGAVDSVGAENTYATYFCELAELVDSAVHDELLISCVSE